MQPANLSLDPAASLWSNTSPNNNLFTQTSSPENTAGESSFGMASTGSTFFPQNIGSMMSGSTPDLTKSEGGPSQQMPNLSTTSTATPNGNSAGEVFMGVQSPQPGGVPSWKWTVMSEKK